MDLNLNHVTTSWYVKQLRFLLSPWPWNIYSANACLSKENNFTRLNCIFNFQAFSFLKKMAAASPLNSQTCHHTRSNSLPSRLHPFTSQFDEHFSRLNAFEATFSSSTLICHKLMCLQDLYDCVDELILLPLTQKSLAQEQHQKWVLDGSTRH